MGKNNKIRVNISYLNTNNSNIYEIQNVKRNPLLTASYDLTTGLLLWKNANENDRGFFLCELSKGEKIKFYQK